MKVRFGAFRSYQWWSAAKFMTIPAKYENGVFKPLGDVKIKEGAVVEIHVTDVYPPQEENAKPRSIRDLGFAGMWADRDDIIDGVSYVDHLRDNPRG
jgi:predicted DNA-binding antitoxin AbrB/MazE fold protein